MAWSPLLLLLLSLLVHISNAASPFGSRTWRFQSCDFENVDKCARIVMLFGARELQLPDNEQDMKTHCIEEKSAVRCVADWSKKCLKGFQRQLVQIMLSGGAKNIRDRCNREGSKWYLRNSRCVIDAMSSCHDCMDIVKRAVVTIRRNPNKKEWIPTGCCLIDKFKSCFQVAIEPFCDLEGKRFLNWCVNSYISDILDLVCMKELSHDGPKCTELVSHILPASSNSTEADPHSLFLPLYKLLLDFGDIEEGLLASL